MRSLLSPRRKTGKLCIDIKIVLFDAVSAVPSKVGPFGVCGGVEMMLFDDIVFV